jgi:hypothetical protein
LLLDLNAISVSSKFRLAAALDVTTDILLSNYYFIRKRHKFARAILTI